MDEDEDEGEGRVIGCVEGGKLRIMKDQCSTCIFRPGNLMSLRKGRLKDLVEDVTRNDSYVVCHQTLSDPLGAVCHGSYTNIYTHPIKFAERLNAIIWVEPEAKGA